MLRRAEKAKRLLGDSSGLVIDFILGRLHADGGFMGRGGDPDLYYTVFGLESLHALGAEPPAGALREYILSWKGGESLDLVHLACLARCRAALPGESMETETDREILGRIEACRTRDGGYGNRPGGGPGTVYHSFLALSAYQDLGAALPDGSRAAAFVRSREMADGGFGIEHPPRAASTPVTSAAVMVLSQMGHPMEAATAEWLLERRHASGGFLAAPSAPGPDLLSTATALHALEALGVAPDAWREDGLDFVDSLWSGTGGFRGHWADDVLDCEYTFYGLLALGHLAG
jgi:hypothetical protein